MSCFVQPHDYGILRRRCDCNASWRIRIQRSQRSILLVECHRTLRKQTMNKLSIFAFIFAFIFATFLPAQVQIGKNVQIGGSSGGIGCGASDCIVAAPTGSQSITQPNGTFDKHNALSADENFLTANAGSQTLYAWGNSQTQGFGLPGCTTLTCHPDTAWPAVF